jgi:hypothetical protein
MKKECSVLVISGRTAPIKQELIDNGFKYNASRKSWVKFADIDKFDRLTEEGREIALKHLGDILIDVFTTDRGIK